MSIPDYFIGQTIFLTGATGSVGSVFLEKLLRSCKGVKKVFLLIRPKNGVSPADRITTFLQAPLFALLSEKDKKKVHVVGGDVTLDKMGLTPEDHQQVTSEVTLVFHAAARVFFNASLKSAVTSNLTGTKRILDLCHQILNLESLIYVSTAYCNCPIKESRERLYPIDCNPLDIINFVEIGSPEEIDKSTKRIIGQHPNTYTFSKQLAEHLLNDGREHIKLAIVRPSIVVGTWQEPFPGWIDGSTGATGFIAGVGAGCFRTSQVAPNKIADLVPSDLLVNALLAAAWSLAQPESKSLLVVHLTSGLQNPITWGQYTDYISEATLKHPLTKMLWYPGAKARKSKWRVAVAVHLFQLWPSYVLDLLRSLFNSKQKESLVGIQQKFMRGMVHTRYFCMQQWQFHHANLDSLADSLLPEDRDKFGLNVAKVEWRRHLENCVLGIREHFHKDPPTTLAKARANLKWWRMLHVGAQVIALLWLTYLLQCIYPEKLFCFVLAAFGMCFLNWV